MTQRARLLAPLGALVAVTAVAVAVHAVGSGSGGPARTVLHLRGAGSSAATSALTPADGKAGGSGGSGAPGSGRDGTGRSGAGGDSGYRVVGALPGAVPADARVWGLPGGRAGAEQVRRLATALRAGVPTRVGARWRAGALTVAGTAGQPWYWSPGCAKDQADPSGPPVLCASSGGSGTTGAGTTSSGGCTPAVGAPTGPGTPAQDLPGSAGCGGVPTIVDPPLTDPAPGATAGTGLTEPVPPAGTGSTAPSGDQVDQPPLAKPPVPQPPDEQPTVEPPTAAVVRSAVRPVLLALGLDPAAAHVTGGEVRLDPTLDGLPTAGWATRLQVAADGTVTAGTGWLATPAPGAAYPLVGARAALDALPQPPRMLMLCPAPTCSPEPVREVTGARQGVALQVLQAGAPLLVPAWLYDVRGADEPLVALAVSPRWLDLAEPGASDSTR